MNWQQINYENLLAEITKLQQFLIAQRQGRVRQQAAELGQPLRILRRAGEQYKKDVQCGSVAELPMEPTSGVSSNSDIGTKPKWEGVTENSSVMLDNLCHLFGLSLFDRQLLLFCAGMELNAEFPLICAELSQQPFPCLALALSIFDGHCSALAPQAPLRYFQLIDIKPDNNSFFRQSIVISPWALFYLTGTPSLDPMLSSCLQRLPLLEPQLQCHINSAELLIRAYQNQEDAPGVVQLIVSTGDDQRQVAALVAAEQERPVYEFNLYHLPLRAEEQDNYRRLVEREVLARQCLLLIDCHRLLPGGEPEADLFPLRNWLDCLIRELPNSCVLSAKQAIELPLTRVHYQYLPALPQSEQLKLWQHYLQEEDESIEITGALQELTTQFNLTSRQVRTIAQSACDEDDPRALQEKLWQRSREQSRQQLQSLAQVIPPRELSWDDLILPAKEKESLQAIMAQVKQRQRVYQQWGFAKQVPYGLGINALFAGSSGTGKTMGARIIASQLHLDLYHVDLSSVVDKYIGETEKNLDKIFQAAEDSGAILLFDEADALFGKRSKVQDARDRYANMGISFLLQRMEKYSGLSILTTNLRSAVDDAFLRRLRFIINFPFPGEQERMKIWQCMIPQSAPTVDIDYSKLARLTLAGGSIRNIVLHAAFIAAEARQAITMQHLCEATRQEYLKDQKTLDETLVKDWTVPVKNTRT